MKLSLLGSTGSIGTQTLEVMRFHGLRPVALAAGRNAKLLEAQAREFSPKVCYLADETAGKALKLALADTDTTVRYGAGSLLEAASFAGCDRVMNALSGLSGLRPTLAALDAGKQLLLANKESLTCGGALVAGRGKMPIIPVDSEHSAIFQCLQAGRQGLQGDRQGLRRVVLTASGGAFRGWSKAQLRDVTPEMALRHPNWDMGAKVTVDSATLLNKGLELIEAMHLFGLPPERVSVVVHPQSIVHALVEYTDNVMLSQLGAPDMRAPIQYALLYPARAPGPAEALDLTRLGTLTFEEPDRETFPCLRLAETAAQKGGNMGAVLTGAGEGAVEAFLQGQCSFIEIPERIERAMQAIPFIQSPTVEDILHSAGEAQARARRAP